ncbi:type II toxin-antitoxin system VapC family toxin [Metallosphaera hakonensis]|nr:type II toxin-antitoxin system VapC family toxin [Metallosphaera hakonensis]
MGHSTITLAYYELGNILWKYRDKLDTRVVFSAIRNTLSFMNILDVKFDREILEEAIRRNLTYYDSAYLVIARRKGLDLVS